MSRRRLLATGFLAAALAGLAGGALEWWRFGPSDAAAAARVEAHVRREFDAMMGALTAAAANVAGDPVAAEGLAAGPDAARSLFDLVAGARARASSSSSPEIAVTVYDSKGAARAWVGRPSDILRERIGGPPSYFVLQSHVGLRLVHVQPVSSPDSHRLGAVAAEHLFSPAGPAAAVTPTEHRLSTPIAPVSLRLRYEGAGDRPRPDAFLLHTPLGEPLVEASVAADDLRAARAEWRRHVVAAVVILGGLAILLLAGPLLDRRVLTRDDRTLVRSTAWAAVYVVSAAVAFWLALAWAAGRPPGAAVNLLLGGTAASALAALGAGPVARLRLRHRATRRPPSEAPVRFAVRQIAAGSVVVLLSVLFAHLLGRAVDPVSIDLRHFSLHPWSGSRALLLGGILALHVAVIWTATLTLAAAPASWRLPRRAGARAALLVLWLLPALAGALVAAFADRGLPAVGLIASSAACGVAAANSRRLVAWYRHATVAARIITLFVAFLIPALLLYPFMDFFATRATERLIAEQFAVEAQRHPQALQDRLAEARAEIDALPVLPELVTGTTGPPVTPPPTDSAFHVWSETVLARARLTSSVELYDRDGNLISRFALNLPEYTGAAPKLEPAPGCDWEVFGEAAPFGSEERTLLHAERNICVPDPATGRLEVAGTVLVHVAFDYRTLPFITSQTPYFELFRRTENGTRTEGAAGGDVDVAIYGWGLRPIYASGRSAWPISDELFERIYQSRDPFWASVPREGRLSRVHFANDRARIFAIGYPTLTLFDHMVHLAELTTLAGVVFVVVLLGTGIFTRLSRERPRIGRALLREIRASFYRKLFLAFVLASIIPVLTLAFVIRAYFAELLRNDVVSEASRTATVAQRVIEGSDALLRRGADGVVPVSDDVMIWISQIIGQDVNIFEGPRLVATSERDLFASGLLSTRTPDDVYRAITLDRLPSFVDEDRIGTFSYMIAAAPVQAGGRDAILTVPQAARQREILREIDDLDRGVHLAALCFVLFGAGIGLWLAERIADPVRRLTRATRRIAEGDFDARIAVKSADELKRLVDAFNSMAAELKAQRSQLERTNRLEAWAEMARQVAHEIKNPLTPIQLSAEHLRRVHADRGEPLGPVLDGCVSSILGQVRLLRQISAEFSSFASSPTARRTPVDLREVVSEVVDPYRTGLAGRIAIDNRASGPLPPVLADRTLVARALSNIVENALHAMPGRGQLLIDAAADDGFVTLAVRDTGAGMDPEALARAFEPYFSTKTTGTGLGLAIARRNVELSGGSIDVESEKGIGTTVRVTLPLA